MDLPPDAIISARNERQAMDWSLVLASQGILAFIASTDGVWQLHIRPDEFEKAQTTIQLYQQENRHRRWQQPIRWTNLIMDWRSLFFALPWVVLYIVTDVKGLAEVKNLGVLDNDLVRSGQWWRLFTATTLHADIGHLASNLVAGVLLLGLSMSVYGPGKAVCGTWLAGFIGNLICLLFINGPHRSLGASGMVMGALGLLTVHSLSVWRLGGRNRWLAWRAFAGGSLLLVLLGTSPHSNVTAHFGGFLGGCLSGIILLNLPRKWRRSIALDRVAAIFTAFSLIAAWGYALLCR